LLFSKRKLTTHFSFFTIAGFGFNPGSALLLPVEHVGIVAAHAAVSTALSGAAGGVTALFTNLYIEERRTGESSFSLAMCMNGSLSGLVAITASCGVVEPWAAVVIGMVAGLIYIHASAWLIRMKIDDAVNAIPVHMFSGMWGVVAVGFFSSPRLLILAYGRGKHAGWFYSLGRGSFDATLLGCQICTLLFIVGCTFFTMMPFFIWLNYMGWFRADSLEELVGLDLSYHGGGLQAKNGVKKEYVEAYKRHKGSIRNRRGGGGTRTPEGAGWLPSVGGTASDADADTNQEAAAAEAMEEDSNNCEDA
jgi:ammonia channel protein AmtB